jgi:hypothetical protein
LQLVSATGSAFAVNALIEAGHVELLLGELVKVELPSPSGKKQKIARCPRCQVAVWSNYLVMPNGIAELIVFIRVGTLDAPSKFPPDIHIYASSRQPWVVLPPGSQAVQEYYVTEKVWSQESLARRAALLVAAPG